MLLKSSVTIPKMEPSAEPSAAMLNLSILSFLLGLTMVTWCITRSLQEHQIWSPKAWTNMSWPRLCLILVLLTSWVYLLLIGVLLFGAPPRHTEIRCTISARACILLYDIIRGLVYLCLIERVHIVWSDGRRRWDSPVYRFCFALIIPLGGIAGYMLYQDNSLQTFYPNSALIFMIYDITMNIFLTFLFVAPLVRSTIRSARLKIVALKAIVATSIGLITTTVNGFVLYGLGGEEIIWVCFGACAADVVVNAAVMYWAMQSPPGMSGTVHFSPLSLTNGTRVQPPKDASESPAACEIGAKTVTNSFGMPGRGGSQEATLSNETTVGSISSIPVIDMPQPTMQNTRHVDLYGNHPPGSRLLLSLSTKRVPKSEDSEADISLQEMGLVRNRSNGSEIYGMKFGQTSSKGN